MSDATTYQISIVFSVTGQYDWLRMADWDTLAATGHAWPAGSGHERPLVYGYTTEVEAQSAAKAREIARNHLTNAVPVKIYSEDGKRIS